MAKTTQSTNRRRDDTAMTVGWNTPRSSTRAAPRPAPSAAAKAVNLRKLARRGTRLPSIGLFLAFLAVSLGSGGMLLRPEPEAPVGRLATGATAAEMLSARERTARGASAELLVTADRTLAAGTMKLLVVDTAQPGGTVRMSGDFDLTTDSALLTITREGDRALSVQMWHAGQETLVNADRDVFGNNAPTGAWVPITDPYLPTVRGLLGGPLDITGILGLLSFVPADTLVVTNADDEGGRTLVEGFISGSLIPANDSRYGGLIAAGSLVPVRIQIDGLGRVRDMTVRSGVGGAVSLKVDAPGEPLVITRPAG